jgi:hypothetical protein
MIYRFDSSLTDAQMDLVLDWSWSLDDVHLWRGRSDRPGQYRFDWRIRVEGSRETEFLLRFSDSLVFECEADYSESRI